MKRFETRHEATKVATQRVTEIPPDFWEGQDSCGARARFALDFCFCVRRWGPYDHAAKVVPLGDCSVEFRSEFLSRFGESDSKNGKRLLRFSRSRVWVQKPPKRKAKAEMDWARRFPLA